MNDTLRNQWLNDWLHSWGLEEDDHLSAGEVEELGQMLLADFETYLKGPTP